MQTIQIKSLATYMGQFESSSLEIPKLGNSFNELQPNSCVDLYE